MAIHYTEAPSGAEFVPTSKGSYLSQRFVMEPRLKKRVPKRWLAKKLVRIRKVEDNESRSESVSSLWKRS